MPYVEGGEDLEPALLACLRAGLDLPRAIFIDLVCVEIEHCCDRLLLIKLLGEKRSCLDLILSHFV